MTDWLDVSLLADDMRVLKLFVPTEECSVSVRALSLSPAPSAIANGSLGAEMLKCKWAVPHTGTNSNLACL